MKRRRTAPAPASAKLGWISSLQIVCLLFGHQSWAFSNFLAHPKELGSSLRHSRIPVPNLCPYTHTPCCKRDNYHATSLFATVVKPDSDSRKSSTEFSGKDNSPRKHTKKTLSKGRKRYLVKSMFREAKDLERKGRWMVACTKLQQILEIEPSDAHSHLALARLQARREQSSGASAPQNDSSKEFSLELDKIHNASHHAMNFTTATAREAFQRGTFYCPNSVHLWQAWAIHEESLGNIDLARQLFEKALAIDVYNPYVCHAYGLMEKNKCQNIDKAQQLWERALTETSTAALVCSLGELLIAQEEHDEARELYDKHLPKLESAKDKIEVYLAMAWLEERCYEDIDRARDLLQSALEHFPTSSLVHVALARLEGRRRQQEPNSDKKEGKRAIVRRLANACIAMEQEYMNNATSLEPLQSQNDGGRVYNAWALMEAKDGNYEKARRILAKGIDRYPKDPMVSPCSLALLYLVAMMSHAFTKSRAVAASRGQGGRAHWECYWSARSL